MSRVMGGVIAVVLAATGAYVGKYIYDEVTEPDSGMVTGKDYIPPWVSTSCVSTGKTTTCTPVYVPECYEIRYADGDRKGDACVAPTEYPTYNVGDQYPKRTG